MGDGFRKVPDTAKEDPLNFLLETIISGDSSTVIERQEARGQRDLCNSDSLPFDMNGAKPILESWGFQFAEHDGKDLFIEVEMPAGWKKVPTDHSMWSKLLDDKGRERASLFYKAAFYDRSAFLQLHTRFQIKRKREGLKVIAIEVRDGETVLYSVPLPAPLPEDSTERLIRYEDVLVKQVVAWLKENYPDYENPAAYWDQTPA